LSRPVIGRNSPACSGERDQRADRHPGREQTRAEVDHCGDRREDHGRGRHPPAPGELRAQLEVDQPGRRRGEALDERGAGAGGARQQHPADREGLVDGDVEVGQLPLLRGGDRPAHARDPAVQPDRRRQHEQGHQRELPAQREHRDERRDGGGEVRGHRGGGGGDDGLHAADVVGDPRLHLAGAGAGEEGDRLALQVREHVGAQPVHDPLADGGRDPGLDDAQRGGHAGDGDHADHQPAEQGEVPLRKCVVDDGAQQER
jgi:hypothetical protein